MSDDGRVISEEQLEDVIYSEESYRSYIFCPYCQKRFKRQMAERRLLKKAGTKAFEFKCPHCHTWQIPRDDY